LKEFALRFVVSIFAHPIFASWSRRIMRLSHRLLGIGNHSTMYISGEAHCIKYVLAHYQLETVFDIGAHDGEYVRNFREKGFKGKAYAFEPHPVTFGRLTDYCKTDTKTEAFQFGLSDKVGILTIYDRKPTEQQNGTHHASLYSEVISGLHKSEVEATEIHLTTLDAFVLEQKVSKIDFLKIDTEGHEFSILEGAKQTLAAGKIQLIQFEFGQMNVVSRVFFKDFFDLLHAQYRIYRLMPNSLFEIKHYDPETCEVFHYQNFLAIKR
jgi:FkbM family methyltransferase